MHGRQVAKKKLISVGLPLRLAEVTRLPSRSLRSKLGIVVTGGDGDGHGAMPRSFTVIVTAEPSTARSTSAWAPGSRMPCTNPEKSTGLQSRFRYSSFADGARLRCLRKFCSVGCGSCAWTYIDSNR